MWHGLKNHRLNYFQHLAYCMHEEPQNKSIIWSFCFLRQALKRFCYNLDWHWTDPLIHISGRITANEYLDIFCDEVLTMTSILHSDSDDVHIYSPKNSVLVQETRSVQSPHLNITELLLWKWNDKWSFKAKNKRNKMFSTLNY